MGDGMNRRELLTGSLACAIASMNTTKKSYAYHRCVPAMNPMGQICEAGADLNRLSNAYAFQSMSQWCWAASVSMVFGFYGYSVSQASIVQAVYGTTVNMPAMTGGNISSQLNRVWVDQSGRRFRAQLQGLYDFDARMGGLTNAQIISALANETPLLMGNTSHAMVLVSIAYIPTPMGPQVTNIGLLDPWPGVGFRGPQSLAELVPMHAGGGLRYLALPVITPM